MNTGMLWFDNDPKVELKDKIERASIYYRQKYGQVPNLCYVHPSMVMDQSKRGGEAVEVRTNRMVSPHYLWIGLRMTGEVSAHP